MTEIQNYSPEDSQIDNIDKAEEMAYAGDKLRTIAALHRSAAELMKREVSLGTAGHEITDQLNERDDDGAKVALRLKYSSVGPDGGKPKPDAEVADILSSYTAPAIDKHASDREDAAGRRYDREN